MGSLCLHVGLCLFLMLSGCLGSLVFTLPTTFAVLQQPGQELQLEQGPCSAGALWLQGHEFGAVLSKGVMQGPSLKLGDRPSARIWLICYILWIWVSAFQPLWKQGSTRAHSKYNPSEIKEVGETGDVTCCVQADLPRASWDRICYGWIICFYLEFCPTDLKSEREKLFTASQVCHPDYSRDHQTRDDPVTCLHEGALPALATPAAGKVLQVINSSPAIRETAWAAPGSSLEKLKLLHPFLILENNTSSS